MPSDSAIVRLLYAILSQKCLKDINWEKVAQDPVLSQEISNGHAARMRYSRFKKQMEVADMKSNSSSSSSSTSSAAVTKRKARKTQIIKGKQRRQSSHVKEEEPEAAERSFDSKTSVNSARDIQTPEPEMRGALPVGMATSVVPSEVFGSSSRLHIQPYTPNTPLTSFSTPTHSQSHYSNYVRDSATPSPKGSFDYTATLNEDMYHSFDSHVSDLGADMLPLPTENGLMYGEYDPNTLDWQQPQPSWSSQPQIHDNAHLAAMLETHETSAAEDVGIKQEPNWV